MIGGALGPYSLVAELGSGGMGKVYRARTARRAAGLAAGSTVALKILHPHLLETEGFFKRFLREAEVGKAVAHENVVRAYDCDAAAADGAVHHFLVMEYVEGQTLRSLLEEMERVPEELCRHIGREVARGLGAIHAAGVVHRDLKPENVLITKDHVVKVMDLGVARLQDEALRLSQTGSFVGSIHYAAPECFLDGGRDVDGRTDLHALGLVLYELASGANPYFADDVPQTLRRVLHEEPRRLGDVSPQLSPFFEEVGHALLAKRPEDRFQDADALAQVLEEGDRSAWWRERARTIRAATKRPLRRARIPRETAVHGRESELTRLRALYEQAKQGEGQVVLVEGEAGIGKSRLVDEFVARLQREGEDLNFLLGSYPPGGAATSSGAFSLAYREQFGEAGCAGYLPRSPVLVPAFDALLRGEPAPAGVEPLTRDSLPTCFVQAAQALAVERPTVILIDDLHFAPEEGRALFTMLALAVPGHRLLLVGTTRPGIPGEWLAGLTRQEQTTSVPLGRLGPKDLAALLRDSFGSERLAVELAGQIGIKSDGNPFFAFEIIRGLREGQFITQRGDGTWVSTRVVDEIRIPSSVLDLVNARVADLSEEERDLLDVAACWGFEFDPGLVGDVIGMARIPLLKRFGQIERAHRLVRASGKHYVFDHHQVQEALYGSLHEQLRAEYHAALAAALEVRTGAAEKDLATLEGALCVDLCHHFLDGAQGGRALRYLDRALTHLEGGYLSAQAVSLAERALAVPDLLGGAERARVLLRLHGPLDLLGRRARHEEAVREAEGLAEEASDDALRGQAARALGWVLMRTARNAEAEAALRRGLEIARTLGDREGEALATGGLGASFIDRGLLAEAREHQERAIAISRELGSRRSEAASTSNLGNILRRQGRLTEGRDAYERALAIYGEIGDRLGVAKVTGNLGIISLFQGRLADARGRFEQGLALCREIGYRQGEAIALLNLGQVWLSLGDTNRAREAFRELLPMCRAIGARNAVAHVRENLACVADEEGDLAAALAWAQEALTLRREIGDIAPVVDSLIVLGDLCRRSGAVEAARAALEEAILLARAQGRAGEVLLALAIGACLPGGDVAAALSAVAGVGEGSVHMQQARLLLWQATGDRAHLVAAKRHLDGLVAHAPPECRDAMLTNVRLNREIMAAAREAGL